MSIVAGVWQREWEEDPLGDAAGADRDTLVLWTQSSESGIYVDIRLPKDSPGRSLEASRSVGIEPCPRAIAAKGVTSPSTKEKLASSRQLDLIVRQKSFAGQLEYKAGDTTSSGEALAKDTILAELANSKKSVIGLCTCFWRRDLDYQPPSGGLDIGVCASEESPRSDGSLLLRETGEDASYAEGWLRLPGTEKGPFAAMELVSENGIVGARRGYFVRAGNRFAYAIGRPLTADAAKSLGCPEASALVATSVGKSLSDAVKELTPSENDMLGVIGSYVGLTGEVVNDVYTILHSTNPELVGCTLFGGPSASADLCCSTLRGTVAVGNEIEQVLAGGETRVWKVVELTNCTVP